VRISIAAVAVAIAFAHPARAQQPTPVPAAPAVDSQGVQNPRPPAGTLGLALRIFPNARPFVAAVSPESPAAAAGFMVDDVVLSIDGRDSLERPLFPGLAPGRAYTVRVKRGDEEHELRIVAAAPAAAP
jgi:S1-C subfamily serine protease